MEKNRDYFIEQLATLNSEIHNLKNRLIVTEIQLENALENIKSRQQIGSKILREFFTMGCVGFGVLLILIFTHNH